MRDPTGSTFADFLAGEANNLEVSIQRYAKPLALVTLCDDTAQRLVELAFGTRIKAAGSHEADLLEAEWHLFTATRTELYIAAAVAIRGHLTTSEQVTRRLIELTATAWRIHREPAVLPLWYVEKGEPGWAKRREAFRTKELFPKTDTTIAPLYERYELLNALVHSSTTSLARRHSARTSDDEVVHKAVMFELSNDDPSEPVRTILYLAQTAGMALDVFATMWATRLAMRAAEWNTARASLTAGFERERDRWASTLPPGSSPPPPG